MEQHNLPWPFAGEAALYNISLNPAADNFGAGIFHQCANPNLCQSDLILSSTENASSVYIVENNISSTQLLQNGAVIEYSAGAEIILNSGFSMDIGSVLNAIIMGCAP